MPPAAPLIGPGAQATMAPPGQTWFAGAPVAKLVAVVTAVFYVLFHAKSSKEIMAMDSLRMMRVAQHSGGGSEWYRYWSSKLTFGSTGELVVGGILLAVLARQFEREMGSRKFGVFWAVVTLSSILLEVVYVNFSTLYEMGYRYQGPYAVLGALMYLYHRYTPSLHRRFIGILGFTFSEKSFYYLWFGQVTGYGGWNTIVATTFGILTAYAFMVTSLHQTIDIPEAIAKPLAAIGARISEPHPRVLAPAGNRGRDAMAGIQRMARNAAAAAQQQQRPTAPPPAPAAPDPAAIEQLTSMGFERARVEEALQVSNNNVERAADRLLSG
jgi:membrane associated rhomboid family serine protease